MNKFVETNLKYVPPEEMIVGVGRHTDTIQYVPINEMLLQLLLKNDVFSQVMISHQSGQGIFKDICDGMYFMTHPCGKWTLILSKSFCALMTSMHSYKQVCMHQGTNFQGFITKLVM